MTGLENSTYVLLYTLSNGIALLLLLIAWRKPRIARLLFFLLFGWASITNFTAAARHPEFYLSYADLALLTSYERFIRGWFSSHIRDMVSLIALGQFLIAASMLLKGWALKAGAIGAIIFLLAIAPLGIGAAFPFSITASIALLQIMRSSNDYLWVSSRKTQTISTDLL